MKNLPGCLALGLVVLVTTAGCGETDKQSVGDDPRGGPDVVTGNDVGRGVGLAGESAGDIQPVSEELRSCPTTRSLVCGKDGHTYLNSCRAGGSSRVAHVGACAGFNCNGVVCVSGFTCRTFTIYGVPVDQCVSNTGTPPSCSCASGSHCVQDPSGATHCEADTPPPPPPNPATLCDGKQCPAGMHCAVITNYGVPIASCMFN
jgi:hypothetical protein